MKIVTLTQEQYDSLSKVILSNLSETINTLNRAKDKWWKDNILGYTPYRVDRISDKTFEVYSNPESELNLENDYNQDMYDIMNEINDQDRLQADEESRLGQED